MESLDNESEAKRNPEEVENVDANRGEVKENNENNNNNNNNNNNGENKENKSEEQEEKANREKEKEKWHQLMDFLIENKQNDFKKLVDEIKADPKLNTVRLLNSRIKHAKLNMPTCLLVEAAMASHVDIVKLFIENGCDMNVTNENNESALFKACWVNNNKICKMLMQAGANPNLHSRDKRSTFIHAACQGNKQMMQLLLNVDGQFEHTFDWDRFINLQSDGNGMSAFLYCCQEGFLDCIQYLISKQSDYNENINAYITRTDGRNGLMLACNENHAEYVRYLLNNLFTEADNYQKKQDILFNPTNRWNILHYIAFWDNAEMIDQIDEFCESAETVRLRKEMRNSRSLAGNTPMMLACKHNNLNCVKALITPENVNIPDPNGFSALYCAIQRGNSEIVKFFCSVIDAYDVNITKDDVSFCVQKGNTAILSSLLMARITQNNADDFDSLEQRGILDSKMVDLWLAVCENRGNWNMYGFLTKLKENGLNGKEVNSRFSYILRLLTMTANEKKNENGDIYEKMRSDMATCNYIVKNCHESTLDDLCKAIETGLTKQECKFGDPFLFLFQKHDSRTFNEVLQTVTEECLTKESEDQIKNYLYFKDTLLDSNIWATSYGNNNGNDNDGDDEDELKLDEANGGRHGNNTLFESISKNIQLNVMQQEQEKLKEQLIELEEKHREDFENLRNSIKNYNLGEMEELSQMKLISAYEDKDFMKDANGKVGIQPEQDITALPIDFKHDFHGGYEYDYKIHLTKILIHAHQIDFLFQNECKAFFDSLSVQCEYSSAPVKTYDRCVLKAKLNYCQREWPRSAHILDFVRCNVVFDDISSLLHGFNQFYSRYKDDDNIGFNKGCIQGIVRIKNGFTLLPSDLEDDLRLSECGYRDIKCNIITEHNKIRLIGEVRFVLKFMLDTEKKQHKIDTLLRKHDLFDKLNKLYYCNDEKTEAYLNSIIMNQNISKFSSFFQTMNENELEYLQKNKQHINNMLQLSSFEEGDKVLRSWLRTWFVQMALVGQTN